MYCSLQRESLHSYELGRGGCAQRFSTVGARSRNRLGCLGSATLWQEQAPKPRGKIITQPGYD